MRSHLHTIHRMVIREVGNKFKIVVAREGKRRCSCETISFMDTLFFYVCEVTTVRLRLSVFYIELESLVKDSNTYSPSADHRSCVTRGEVGYLSSMIVTHAFQKAILFLLPCLRPVM